MKLRPLLRLLVLPLFLLSCDTDFDLNAEWQDITVVYGILDQTQSTHYIRIQKAFLGDGNVMHMALEPDSNLYPSKLNVKMEEWNGTVLQRQWQLDTISIENKEPGIFFSPVQPLYYFQSSTLNQANQYRLIITNQETGKVIHSSTELVSDFSIQRPLSFQQFNFASPNSTYTEIKWRLAKNGGRYQVGMRFNFLEFIPGNDTIPKYVDWYSGIVKPELAVANELDIRFPHDQFFAMIRNQIPVKNEVVRIPVNMEIMFFVAATDLSTYIEVNEPTSSVVQEKPQYSNIENGLGIFSARYSKKRAHQFNFETINALTEMEGYNFQWITSK